MTPRCEELQLIDRCHRIDPRMGTPEQILLKHTQEQYDVLKSTENQTDNEKLEELSSHYDAVFFHPVSITYVFYTKFPFLICKYVMKCQYVQRNCN